MKSKIHFQKIWFDDDIIEIKVEISDGTSLFSNNVYLGYDTLETLIKDLNVFRENIYGGIYDIKLGEFGPEYANGAFQARLHFQVPGKLYISSYQQSEFEAFPINEVASEAKFYLKTEPILLDNFITELKKLNSGGSDEAELKCN